ncbi:MAG: shikimate kinase [Promethearchaeota archaeon]|jgi:shikimate kinase
MNGYGEAIAYGAATIINAIALGKGAAFGVDLWTKAKIILTEDVGVIKGKIISDPNENNILIRKAVSAVFRHFGVEKKYGANVETDSNIPIARGMKSSSVASNALVLATTTALKETLDDWEIVKLGIEASLNAKTTITGAFDDASASFFGNIVLTDNYERRILRRFIVEEELIALFHVPSNKSYTFTSDLERMKLIYKPDIAIEALKAGAVASGLTGKGPATVALVPEENVERVLKVWKTFGDEIVKARINRTKAHPMR